jgi:hypothetical protein
MKSKGNAPNAAQKRWMRAVADYGCAVTADSMVQIHHVKGATFRHNKVKIGHWYILPLCERLHDIKSNDTFNVTHNKTAFESRYGKQVDLFLGMVEDLEYFGADLPPVDVLNAIEDLRR